MIRVDRLSRRFGAREIIKDVSLEIRNGEIFTLIGPSGSGKTTIIRLIDLLDTPASGKIYFDGVDTATSEAGRLAIRRRMGMVFQKPAVLNTTVAKNIAFGLEFRGVAKSEIHGRVQEALELVGLPEFESRRAITLSGGEMQRVAIARAMVTRPEVLLLDEPTANLDPVSSGLIEDLVLRIREEFKTTIIMSTHDMAQGQRLADRIGVIMEGRLAQVGGTSEIFYQPKGRDIARFVGIEAITGGKITENKAGHALIRVGETCFEALTDLQEGQRVAIFIRPEEVTLAPSGVLPEKTSMRNQISGRITRIIPFGPFVRVSVDCGFILVALITRRSCTDLGLAAGTTVIAGVKATAIHVLPDDDARAHP
ncbi:ABC transporter ATP-binding protein [uncultured Methanoregula sp.]|uniref:ABC transporter ATP-binding protein n=1 Tax=uncultured Methanoregula sp. TaxID=1005933 RepID=UPI002AAAB036|nr:ABC transporter ATP-binding protein [uncultured Methanoregula sp.]